MMSDASPQSWRALEAVPGRCPSRVFVRQILYGSPDGLALGIFHFGARLVHSYLDTCTVNVK
jgi:hypothetical protein